MDVSYIIEGLNDAQRDAVCAPPGNLLVLAGAGSGKTRVLVHRIAWLIQTENLSPHSILAVTFTNKAAGEMRSRIEELLKLSLRGMWVGTFHSLAHRFLRLHWQEANLPQNFQILDSDDQFRAIKRSMANLDLDTDKWPPRQAQWYINSHKDEGRRPQNIDHFDDPVERRWLSVYEDYDKQCKRAGLVDFAELLFRAHEVCLQNPQLLSHYQQRFRTILVDEFQDTNTIQYAWIRLLAGDTGNVFAVGDDDQSIYGWRGARIENIHQFTDDYPNTKTVRLEQNYRSTGNILKAANALIANNYSRLGKNLWTDDTDGEPIQLYRAFNEQDEARYIVEQIQQWFEQGGKLSETAILYRSNAQSRVIEETLIQMGIAYRVYGGLRFFERAEIKDALAYVRLVNSPSDDTAFERIVNTPTRGIGNKTTEAIRDYARINDTSLMQAAFAIIEELLLPSRAVSALAAFVDLIRSMKKDTIDMELYEVIEHTVHESKLFDHYDKDKSEKGQTRIENVKELINAAKYFEYDEAEEELDKMSMFLSHAALEAGETQGDKWQDCVQLMTLHSAKGLEFSHVFMSGVEEGLFPHQRSSEDPVRLEEERRLCYVGITRAQQKLTISHAETRRIYGNENYAKPSRFIREIPSEFMNEVRLRGSVSYSAYSPTSEESPDTGYALGQRVTHAKFGEGVVLNFEGQGTHARIQINFNSAGTKWLVVAYANLQVA